MPSHFQNPGNPLVAMWASAAEAHLRKQHPDLSISDIRRLPFMQGVYEHISQLRQKKRLTLPPAQAGSPDQHEAAEVARMAYLSQSFFDLAMATAAVSYTAQDSGDLLETLYLRYIDLLNNYNRDHQIDDFSTDDLAGFGLCLIVWIGLVGATGMDKVTRLLLDYLLASLGLSPVIREKIENYLQEFWNETPVKSYQSAYRKPGNYKAIPWQIPADAQIVLLGDWGTSMDDAREFLKALWRKAYLNAPGKTIVFIHLGDIYYCGLPYECEHYFRQVFIRVGQELQQEINNSNFNPRPPIFTIPGNHEYYSYGYGYFQMLDILNQGVPGIAAEDLHQKCSFFCLRTANQKWQFLGMDTGQADGNAALSALQGMGDIMKSYLTMNSDWNWVNISEKFLITVYEDFTGPFQPELQPDEVKWLRDRIEEFGGKTIMLSHHQLFSRRAQINHRSPVYMNTWLDRHFRNYFGSRIAAWYWGHEHSFAVYMDGLMGLNKGRLLGSSSYEATEQNDAPYENNYPAIPFARQMTNDLIKKNKDGLYNHTGAILTQTGSELSVKYYQFPAWSQLDAPPAVLNLEEVTAVSETITTKFTTLKPTWIGDEPIAKDTVTTDHSPALTSYNDRLYMLYVSKKENSSLMISSADAAGFQPERLNDRLSWMSPLKIKVDNKSIESKNSAAIAAAGGNLYALYRDNNKQLQCISTPASGNLDHWTRIGTLTDTDDAAAALCYFRNRLYIVYRKANDSKKLSWASYNIATGEWIKYGNITDRNHNHISCSNVPSICADPYRLFMVYQAKDNSDICWATATPPSDQEDKNAEPVWDNLGKVQSLGKSNNTTNPDTDTGLTLEYGNSLMMLVYVSDNSEQNLTQCALTDIDKDSTGQWVGSNTVKATRETDHSSTARSSRAPSLAITSGGGFLVYRGKEHSDIYWAYY
jgi:hypothetical protein